MGLKEVQEYATKLKKAEKMKEIREQVQLSVLKEHVCVNKHLLCYYLIVIHPVVSI